MFAGSPRRRKGMKEGAERSLRSPVRVVGLKTGERPPRDRGEKE